MHIFSQLDALCNNRSKEQIVTNSEDTTDPVAIRGGNYLIASPQRVTPKSARNLSLFSLSLDSIKSCSSKSVYFKYKENKFKDFQNLLTKIIKKIIRNIYEYRNLSVSFIPIDTKWTI